MQHAPERADVEGHDHLAVVTPEVLELRVVAESTIEVGDKDRIVRGGDVFALHRRLRHRLELLHADEPEGVEEHAGDAPEPEVALRDLFRTPYAVVACALERRPAALCTVARAE